MNVFDVTVWQDCGRWDMLGGESYSCFFLVNVQNFMQIAGGTDPIRDTSPLKNGYPSILVWVWVSAVAFDEDGMLILFFFKFFKANNLEDKIKIIEARPELLTPSHFKDQKVRHSSPILNCSGVVGSRRWQWILISYWPTVTTMNPIISQFTSSVMS